jgi:hypothetical protein
MSAKRRRLEFRTVLIILIILLIILALAYVILTAPTQATVYTPEEILRNPTKYINDEIIVRGEYYIEDGHYVIPPTIDANPYPNILLPLDLTNINENITENYQYKFTGILQRISGSFDPNAVELVVSKVDPI